MFELYRTLYNSIKNLMYIELAKATKENEIPPRVSQKHTDIIFYKESKINQNGTKRPFMLTEATRIFLHLELVS